MLLTLAVTACGGGGGGGGGGSFLPGDPPEAEIEITTTTLPEVDELPYAAVLEASGGAGDYQWTLLSDGGTGFTLDASGVLRGESVPDVGTYGLTFRVEDRRGRSAERSLTLVVSAQPLSVATTALPQAEDQIPYSAVLEAVGGEDPYSWSLLDDGDTGLAVSEAGVLSGTPRGFGTYGLTFRVTDSKNNQTQRSLVLQVTGDAPVPLQVTTTALPQVDERDRYAAVLAAAGGTGNYSWTLVNAGGTGMTLTREGVLSGKAPGEGLYGLTVRVSDTRSSALKSLSLTVNGDQSPLTVETNNLETATAGVRYAAVVTATGGNGEYTWTLLDGGGAGLSLSRNGVLSGVPGNSGTYGITVRVSDGETAATRSLTVTVQPADGQSDQPAPLTITSTNLPDTTAGAVYAAVVSASGGSGNYTWRLLSDSGSGLSLNSNGVLSGTAPTPGNYGLTFEVDDGERTAVRSLTLSVSGDDPLTLSITTQELPSAIAGTRYASVLRATGGTGNYTWSLPSGDGGTGLTLDANGILSGIAPAVGNYGLTVQVADGETVVSASLTLTVTGVDLQPLNITTDSLPDAIAGTRYAATLTAAGGSGTYSWSLVNGGGSGLNLDANGVLRGTAPDIGDYGVTVRVDDGINQVNRSYRLIVTGTPAEPLTITSSSLPAAVSGTRYAAVLDASGGNGDYSWTLERAGGSGLTLNSDGVFNGTAPAPGDYGLTVQVSDTDGNTARRSMVLSVAASGPQSLQITTTSLATAVTGSLYAATVEASGGNRNNYAWQLLDDGGSGLVISSGNVISGTAPSPGSYGLTVQVSDGSQSAARSFVLTVSASDDAPLSITNTSLPSASADTRYVTILEAQGGSGNYQWALLEADGTGLALNSDGILSGTVNNPGTYGLTFEVNDGQSTERLSLTLTVEDGGPQALTIITELLPDATTTIYAAVLEAEGGVGPYTWSLLADPNNSGFDLRSTGALVGTTPAPGQYALTVQVTDSEGTSVTRTLGLVVVGGPSPAVVIITDENLPPGQVNRHYATVLRATGGTGGEYTWTLLETQTLSGGPSAGLALDSTFGVLSWQSADVRAGVYELTVQANRLPGSDTSAAVKTFTLQIN
tara:strand:+ start:334 stop:3645 length:3312 start_codon:yes stop_codon:yes gene_type:complete